MKLFQKLALTTAFTTLGLMTWETNPSFAATFTVNNTFDSGAGSLQQAIIDANTAGGNDIIDFLLGSGSQTINTSGELRITDNLVINGLGANLLTLSNNYFSDIFSIGNGANVEISGLTIARGRNGLFISSNSTATVTNSTIRSNFQEGIVNRGQVTLVNTTVVGNGDIGIDNSGTATLINSDVSSNYIAGIINSGTTTLTNSSVSGSLDGISNMGTVALTNSTVTNNRLGITNRGTTTVINSINSTFNDNGAGIINEGTATVTNSTLSRNSTAIYNEGTATVTNSTLSRNGVGIFNLGETNIRNTIIAQNSTDLFDPLEIINDLGYNLIGNGEGSVFVNGVNGNIVGSAANPVNPLLGSLANNGGSTQTQALLPGSIAIDAANPNNFPTTDQRGVSRPQGARADIGAFEVVQTSPPPKSVPEPSALGGLAILGLFGLLRKKVRFSH
jgi:hypothetical protein